MKVNKLKDWEVLDEKIDEANQKIEEVESKNKMISHRNKLQLKLRYVLLSNLDILYKLLI